MRGQGAIAIASKRFPYLNEERRRFSLVQRSKLLIHETLRADDGRPLSVYSAGDRRLPLALVITPVGVSALLVLELIDCLRDKYSVVTWESRGLPDHIAGVPLRDADCTRERQCADLRSVLAHWGGRATALVSYCSGAYVAFAAIAGGLVAPRRLCVISPPLDLGVPGERTMYQRTLIPLLPRIARSGMAMARVVRALLRKGAIARSPGILGELETINDLPFDSDEATHRYAQLHAPWLEHRWSESLRDVRIPTAIAHGTEDTFVHPDTVTSLARALPSCGVRLFSGEGHFAVHTSPALLSMVKAFLSDAS